MSDVKGSIPIQGVAGPAEQAPSSRGAPTARGMSAPPLVAEGLSVRLGGALALRKASFSVAAGEVLGVFGPSGAGKSTLFRALAGEERLAAGRVLLAGGRRDRPAALGAGAARAGVRASDAERAARPHGRGEPRRLPGARAPARRRPARRPSSWRRSASAARAGVRAGALSGGERRRLELARALGAAPARPALRRALRGHRSRTAPSGLAALLRALADGGAAVVLADHHVAQALGLCDRAALLVGGRDRARRPAGRVLPRSPRGEALCGRPAAPRPPSSACGGPRADASLGETQSRAPCDARCPDESSASRGGAVLR